MQTANRVQTVLRLDKFLFERAKMIAGRRGMSFNTYVEKLIEKDAGLVFPKLPKDFKVSEEILNLVPKESSFVRPTQEELDNDPKLAYLMEKFGLI